MPDEENLGGFSQMGFHVSSSVDGCWMVNVNGWMFNCQCWLFDYIPLIIVIVWMNVAILMTTVNEWMTKALLSTMYYSY